MKKGIYQVVCSDEGMMTEEFEDCLKPVIKAVRSVGGEEAKRWARTMLSADKAGYVLLRKLAEGR